MLFRSHTEASSRNYNSHSRDFKFELLPLHSPLLGQSLLVSFPPLIDMLKFSGYPCLRERVALESGHATSSSPSLEEPTLGPSREERSEPTSKKLDGYKIEARPITGDKSQYRTI